MSVLFGLHYRCIGCFWGCPIGLLNDASGSIAADRLSAFKTRQTPLRQSPPLPSLNNRAPQCPPASSVALPPAAAVLIVTVCSAQKRYR